MTPLKIDLPDGRTLAWTQYGALDGTPVIVLDGPGSRGLARATAAAAEQVGVRLIAPDRPGFLASTPKPGRTVADWPADMAALADATNADTFGLLAQSGGTPYALATAAAMPERVRALAFTGGIMPFSEPGALDDVGGPMLGAFKMGRRAPWLLRRMMRMFAKNPQKAADRALKDLAPKDAEQLKDPAKLAIHVDTTAEIMAYTDEMVNEIKLLWQPWPVDLGAVRAPVSLWWGDHDVTHPEMHSRWLSKHLGDAPVHVVKDAATFGLFEVFPDVLRFASNQPSRDAQVRTRTQ
jgi:pimeloyl-ACP methyl ester carboxylesterase